MRDAIHGDVKFIFQAAEEMPPGGAIALVEACVLDDVDQIFGLHVFPMTKTGTVGFSYGAMTASSDLFDLTIRAVALTPWRLNNQLIQLRLGLRLFNQSTT